MKPAKNSILTVNGGSSSIKFAFYEIADPLKQLFYGEMEGIGTNNTSLNFQNTVTNQKYSVKIKLDGSVSPVIILIDWLEKQEGFDSVKVIGHRIVCGMDHTGPAKITVELLNELKDIWAYDPEHLPIEIKLIEEFEKRNPAITQIACFDTSFHSSMPAVAKMLSIPRRYSTQGIKRYGFHGLSYAYLIEDLKRTAGAEVAKGKLIIAHLGSGASIAAIREGKAIDTSMGFSPASGLPMGTRTGDLDPGVAAYLIKSEGLNSTQFNHLINHESGLMGISETSSDMRDLLKSQSTDHRAAEAVDFFCYQTKKWIGAYAAALGGLDTLVFSGGIGENSAEIRDRICTNLQFLGIEIDEAANLKNEAIISGKTSKVLVRVIRTNEELMIAKLTHQLFETLS